MNVSAHASIVWAPSRKPYDNSSDNNTDSIPWQRMASLTPPTLSISHSLACYGGY